MRVDIVLRKPPTSMPDATREYLKDQRNIDFRLKNLEEGQTGLRKEMNSGFEKTQILIADGQKESNSQTTKNALDIRTLKVKSGVWGAVSASVITIAFLLARLL